MKSHPSAKPRSGEMKMKAITLIHPDQTIALKPARAMAAPAYAPTRAWEEEDGSPTRQVTTFQVIAPTRPARITNGSTTRMSIKPPPIVLATAVPNVKAATKLKKAAQA